MKTNPALFAFRDVVCLLLGLMLGGTAALLTTEAAQVPAEPFVVQEGRND